MKFLTWQSPGQLFVAQDFIPLNLLQVCGIKDDKLCLENGEENVGTEIMVGRKRIDAVVKGNDFYDIYEVKTEKDPFDCVTQALGQLCQYAYLFCRDKIGKLIVVGPSKTTSDVEEYLSTLRKNHSLHLHYISV